MRHHDRVTCSFISAQKSPALKPPPCCACNPDIPGASLLRPTAAALGRAAAVRPLFAARAPGAAQVLNIRVNQETGEVGAVCAAAAAARLVPGCSDAGEALSCRAALRSGAWVEIDAFVSGADVSTRARTRPASVMFQGCSSSPPPAPHAGRRIPQHASMPWLPATTSACRGI